ncbi:hypothetical protein P8625_07120 [Tenacibaculum tangerinum]|uniref:Uncharacterized protein n=1 Tax=Tenacibaculum tangerinum TaxID=3038772 RepID=A0ABY8L8I3_9FLAO|nr:hypothetical protein [Tenacibaculum tangerinum]WGH76907.1 hypothetical protein P8625_07120 [Tenacibaculum tangerinum]
MYKKVILLLVIVVFMLSCSKQDAPIDETPPTEPEIPPTETTTLDLNDDGKLNILILGTSNSINSSSSGFASDKIAIELQNILSNDESVTLDVNVVSEDIYKSKNIEVGLGQAGNVYNFWHYSHSLMQYYYWPEGKTERWENLANQSTNKWDYVIMGADPYIVSKVPGYYALGVNKIASKVLEGGAKPMLLLVWPKDEANTTSVKNYEEFTYRIAEGAENQLETIPAGLAWNALAGSKKDTATEHPTPNGAYVAAAAIYSQLSNKSATASAYSYDDEIADTAFSTKTNEENKEHYTGDHDFMSPYKNCSINDATLNYNHTGTSSENGILNGLKWIITQSDRTLVSGGTSPINFNYGRANTNFEASKRYKVDPSKFDFSLGFPMQDNGNHGNTSMLYGLDKRTSDSNNGTDLGTALYMIRNSELPNARAIPIRTLYAQIKEAIPSQSAYRDDWHMHGILDRATGAFMYTLLTGECVLGAEPSDTNSDAWKSWMAQKIGHQTAYTFMSLKGTSLSCN